MFAAIEKYIPQMFQRANHDKEPFESDRQSCVNWSDSKCMEKSETDSHETHENVFIEPCWQVG